MLKHRRIHHYAWVAVLTLSLVIPSYNALAKTPTPTPAPARRLEVPILLYHHIGEAEQARFKRYTVSQADFERQMQLLKAWGYTSISLGDLIAGLVDDAPLPDRPVIITFDDGYQDVFTHALPILKELDYTATVFVIGRQIGIKGYLSARNLEELVEQGWQVGNHTYNHHSLRSPGIDLTLELETARQDLEDALGVPVSYFSFPYGLTSQYVTRQVEEAGYLAAVGLGGGYLHSEATRLYLSRIEIQPDTGVFDFMHLLPWVGPPDGRDAWDRLVQ